MLDVLLLGGAVLKRAALERDRPVPYIALPNAIGLNATHDGVAALSAEHISDVLVPYQSGQRALTGVGGRKPLSTGAASLRYHLRSVDDQMRDPQSIRFCHDKTPPLFFESPKHLLRTAT